jgi:predicted lipid-binding transport protein (Tim44 family)
MWGGLAGGLAGFALGGLLGSLLFGGLGGGVGVLDLLVLAGLGYLGFLMLRRRPQPALAGPAGQAPAPVDARPAAAAVAVAPPSDLARGIGHIRQMDAGFDPGDLARSASQIFFRIQSAWSAGDLGPVSELLGPELRAALEADLARLRAQGRVNRIENMLIEEAEVVEAWQESGQDFATVRFRASLLDYTLEESGGRVVEGSRTEPVRFEEDWTFTRPVGPSPWRLSAVTQVPAA